MPKLTRNQQKIAAILAARKAMTVEERAEAARKSSTEAQARWIARHAR